MGNVDDDGKRLIRATHDALMKAIAACKPGMRYRDIGDIISKHASANGCAAASKVAAGSLK